MIIFRNVTKSYSDGRNNSTPLKNVNIHIKDGETVVLNGPSGSGKSTLLNMVSGMTKPTEGVVSVGGKQISKLPEHFAAVFRRENIGIIFQQFHLIEDMTTLENICIPMLPTSVPAAQIKAKAEALAERLGISSVKNLHAGKLSGGEMQRTAIARALINSPKIILADEPTANLDSRLTEDFINILKELKSEGKTILVATHDPALTSSGFADRIVPIKKEV